MDFRVECLNLFVVIASLCALLSHNFKYLFESSVALV